MLPRLRIPEWQPPPDGEAAWASEDDTPRSPARQPGSLPSSPSARKTKSRAARSYLRTSSLKDTKVLVVSTIHRTESAQDPSLFQYHQHFDGPWQLVGKTHLSEVFRVRHRASGQVYAVKRSRRRFRSKLQRERCLREIRAVAALPAHPNIVNQYRAWQEGGHFYIQMDYCEGGSLAHQAHRASAAGQLMSDEQLWCIACQAAQGLSFLHSHAVLHLDIKPDNIYRSAGTWRIGDFGLAVARDAGGSVDWEEGDGDYVAPELLQAGCEPSPAADIFSLGATLYECATGSKLPRSNGWAEGDAERLELPGRPPAFVRLLGSMLQPSPALRPTADQVVEAVAAEQPAVAVVAAEAVAVAAAAAIAKATLAAERAAAGLPAQSPLQASPVLAVQPTSAAELAPSPFMQVVRQPADSPTPAQQQQQEQEQPASPQAAAADEHFSFDVPQQCQLPDSFAFTPGPATLPPLRPHNRRSSGAGGGAPPGSTVKRTPAGRARLGAARWAPALSPLISEGALTPGAAAALAGFTPVAHGSGGEGAPTPIMFGQGSGGSSGRGQGTAATPLDTRRPAPLQLPQSAALAMPSVGSGGMHGLSSAGTQDSRDGWRLCRRDILSPDSDALNACSRSDSEYEYSYSAGYSQDGTAKTLSDMDFADALSPMSQDLGSLLPLTGTSPFSMAATPDSLAARQQQQAEEGLTPDQTPDSSGPQQQHGQHSGGDAHAAAGLAAVGGPGHAHQPQQRLQQAAAPAASLAWDLYTSPDFLMQLPPGSPASLSRSSSLEDGASLPSRTMSVRRFPTLDSWGSQLDGACSSKPPLRCDSLAALAQQRFTNTFGSQEAPAAGQPVEGAGPAGGSGPLAGRGLRKRQHSSRRTLIAALSRDNSVASSIDGMQPPQGKVRHLCDPDSACGSPVDRGASSDLAAPAPGAFRHLHRIGSSLGREAAAAAAAAAEQAAKATAAHLPPDMLSPSGTPTQRQRQQQQHPSRDSDAEAGLGGCNLHGMPPASPLHARMTGMKLRDG